MAPSEPTGDPDLDHDPEFLPWDGHRVPITLLGGYLGAGKTTLLNELLSRVERPVAVLVNDVGQINVDAGLVRRRSSDVVEFTDGCVCCGLGDGLSAALDALRARPEAPDHVVLELSGLAEPARVVPWASSSGFRLDGVVVLADTDQILEQLEQPLVAAAVQAQLQAADLIVFSKIDLVDDQRLDRVRTTIADLAPGVPTATPGSALAGAGLLELGGGARAITATAPVTLFDNHTVETVDRSFADARSLTDWLNDLADGVVRVKGAVSTADGGRLLVQRVGRRSVVEPLPVAEYDQPDGLVVIRLKG